MPEKIADLGCAPIEEGGTRGYAFDDLRRAMPPEQWERFNTWIDGQTCAILQGRVCALTYDVERFLEWERWRGGQGRPLPPVFD